MIHPQAVARREALDPIAADGLPEMRHVGLEDVPGFLGRLLAPDPVDQGVGRYELVRADEEMRKDRPLLWPAERDGATSRVHLERSQNAEMHPPPVDGTYRPSGQERSDLLRDVAPLRSDRQDANGIGESFEVQLAAIQVPNALDRTGQVHEALTAEDLPGPGLAAEPGREVQSPAAEPALDRHRLTGVQPDPDGEREIRRGPRCLKQPRLQLHRCPDGLTGGTEHRQGFVSPQLDHRPVPGLDVLTDDAREPRRQPGSRFIAPLLGERCVSADIRDQEGIDLPGRFVRGPALLCVAVTHPGRSIRSLTDLLHTAQFRPSAPWPPDSSTRPPVPHGDSLQRTA